MKKLIFKRTHKEAITPYRANDTDSGLDLFTCEEIKEIIGGQTK